MMRQPWEHDRDCLYVVTDGPAPCTCAASHYNDPFEWKLPPECPRCKGAGRVGIMACNHCGATGRDPSVVSSHQGNTP